MTTEQMIDPVLGEVTLIADSVRGARCRVVDSRGDVFDVECAALRPLNRDELAAKLRAAEERAEMAEAERARRCSG